MKIKLISPRTTLRPMDSEFKRRMSPSLSLLVVAPLTPPEHTVTVEDENTGRLNLDDQPDLVGITCNFGMGIAGRFGGLVSRLSYGIQ
jgi:hypothetical protein